LIRHPPPPEPNSELTAELPLLDELEELEPVEVDRLPESLTEVAEMAPFDPFTPATTTVSPGRSAFFDTPWLLVTLVALESVTLITFPVLVWT
jgi:hypothetical protein